MAKMARTYDVPVAKVDVSTETGGNLAREHGVSSTPTLILFRNEPSVKVKYPKLAPRDWDSMIAWVGYRVEGEAHDSPEPTEEGVQDWAPLAKLKVVGLLGGESGSDSTFEQLIDAIGFMLNPSNPGADVPVGLTSLPSSEMDKLGISCQRLPCIALLRDFEFEAQNVFVFEEEKEKANLKLATRVKSFMTWFEPKKLPTLIPASDETESLFLKDNAKHGNALAVYFGNDESAKKEVQKLAAEFSPRIKTLTWVHAAQTEFGEELGKMVGVQPTGFPEFVVWEFGKAEDDDRVFKLTKQAGVGHLNEDVGKKVRSFIESWQAGGLTVEKDPVIAVNSMSFEKFVYDKSKDVLVEFYAPWCGHCKALAPEYKQVAQHYEGDHGIAIVKMDADAYEHPSAKIKTLPTLIIYPASDKKSPITLKFEGGRDKRSIIDLVEKHRTTSPTGTATCAAGDASCNAGNAAKAEVDEDDDDDDVPHKEF